MDKVLAQFLSVAEKGSITAAAAALSIAQPSLTGNIKRLEATLGVPLFERSARGVTLTRYGRTLYESVDVMQRLYENALQAIERQRIEKEEGLSLGSGYSWWSLYLKDFVLDYCARHPEASVNVVLGSALRCMDQLVAGDIVFSIGHRIGDLDERIEVDFIEIGEVRDGNYVRIGHPLLAAPRTAAEVAAYPSVLAFPPEARYQKLLLGHGTRQVAPDVPEYVGHAFTSNSLEACLDFARGSDAVLRHTDVMAPELEKRGVVQVEMSEGSEYPPRVFGIYVLPERRKDPRVAALVDEVAERLAVLIRARQSWQRPGVLRTSP